MTAERADTGCVGPLASTALHSADMSDATSNVAAGREKLAPICHSARDNRVDVLRATAACGRLSTEVMRFERFLFAIDSVPPPTVTRTPSNSYLRNGLAAVRVFGRLKTRCSLELVSLLAVVFIATTSRVDSGRPSALAACPCTRILLDLPGESLMGTLATLSTSIPECVASTTLSDGFGDLSGARVLFECIPISCGANTVSVAILLPTLRWDC